MGQAKRVRQAARLSPAHLAAHWRRRPRDGTRQAPEAFCADGNSQGVTARVRSRVKRVSVVAWFARCWCVVFYLDISSVPEGDLCGSSTLLKPTIIGEFAPMRAGYRSSACATRGFAGCNFARR